MNAHIRSITEMNTFWYQNSLDGIDEEQAWRRTTDATNSLGFVALHALDARYYFAKLAGLELPNPLGEYLKGVRTIEDLKEHPTLDQIRTAWDALAAELHDYVALVDLERELTHRFPIEDRTVGGILLFGMHHDAYHIGQLSMLRKTLGMAATVLQR